LLGGESEGKEEVFVSPDFNAWFLQVIFRDLYITTCILDTGDDETDEHRTVQKQVPTA
jgi:hypothetical protein